MWKNIRLQPTSHIVGVFLAAGGVDVATVVLLVENILGILLRLVGAVWKCQCRFEGMSKKIGVGGRDGGTCGDG